MHTRRERRVKSSTHSSLVGFYWGPRAESADDTASRLHSFMGDLSEVMPHFTAWRSLPELRAFKWRERRFAKQLVAKGSVRTDIGKKVIAGAGFMMSLMTETPPEEPLTLSVQCGSTVPGIGNLCMLACPQSSPAYSGFAQLSSLVQICELIVKHWDPDTGIVTSHELQELVFPEKRFSKSIGHVTYRSSRITLPRLPRRYESQSIAERGILVFATKVPFDSIRKEHLESLKDLAVILGVESADDAQTK
jgi:hypothetical protein